MPLKNVEAKRAYQREFYRKNADQSAKTMQRTRTYRERNVTILNSFFERHCNAIFRIAWKPTSITRLMDEISTHTCVKCKRWQLPKM